MMTIDNNNNNNDNTILFAQGNPEQGIFVIYQQISSIQVQMVVL